MCLWQGPRQGLSVCGGFSGGLVDQASYGEDTKESKTSQPSHIVRNYLSSIPSIDREERAASVIKRLISLSRSEQRIQNSVFYFQTSHQVKAPRSGGCHAKRPAKRVIDRALMRARQGLMSLASSRHAGIGDCKHRLLHTLLTSGI